METKVDKLINEFASIHSETDEEVIELKRTIYKADQFRRAFLINNNMYYEFNVSKNLIEEDVMCKGPDGYISLLKLVGLKVPCTYDEFIDRCIENLAEGYKDSLDPIKTSEILQRRYDEGERQFSIEYGMNSGYGQVFIYRQTNVYYIDKFTGDLMCSCSANEITIEAELKRKYLETVEESNRLLEDQNNRLMDTLNKLEQANATVERVHEALHSGSWTLEFDSKGNIIDINFSDNFRHMMGYENEKDFPNEINRWSKSIYEPDRKVVDEKIRGVLKNIKDRPSTIDVEFRSYTKSGEIKWFKTFSEIKRNAEGYPESLYGIYLDITDRKEKENIIIEASTRDALTGLGNRMVFEENIKRLSEPAIKKSCGGNNKIAVFEIDINRLKEVNDDIGHEAGDELIKGVADILRESFGGKGCFRTGGDEFVIIIENSEKTVEEYKNLFLDNVKKWHGKLVDKLAVSIGGVSSDEYRCCDISKMLRVADKRMYADKADYYEKNGVDRRTKKEAFNALINSYVKVLKIDLLEDRFEVIKSNETENFNPCDENKISLSKWFKNLANSGEIYIEDIEEYNEKTNLDNIREKLFAGGKDYVITFRKKSGDSFVTVMLEVIPARDFKRDKQIVYFCIKHL